MKSTNPLFQSYSLLIAQSTCILLALLLLNSCYTVQITSKDGSGVPNPLNQVDNPHRGLKVDTISKVIKFSPFEKGFVMYLNCSEENLYSVEYKVSLGGLFLSAITFGRCRKVKIKYVCAEEN